MNFLLAARGRCVVRRNRSKREVLYASGQLLGSLMRHLRGIVSIEVPLVSSGVVRTAGFGILIPTSSGADRVPSR